MASGGEGGVDVGRGVVDAGAECGALGEAEGVAAREGRHVGGAEAFVGELGGEGGEVSERRGEIALRRAFAGGSGVSPP